MSILSTEYLAKPADDGLPKLLVSVRNVAEAKGALAGGCDILDIKEPANGAMGMSDERQIAAIFTELTCGKPPTGFQTPVSVALGESTEWDVGRSPPVLPGGIAFLKLGTAGLAHIRSGTDYFRKTTARLRQGIAAPKASWISVAYADWREAGGLSPMKIVQSASECGSMGVLIDTLTKSGRGLFDWLTLDELHFLRHSTAKAGLIFALAGQLRLTDVPRLLDVCPDIVGIRSAACRNGLRTAEIDQQAVTQFKSALTSKLAAVHADDSV